MKTAAAAAAMPPAPSCPAGGKQAIKIQDDPVQDISTFFFLFSSALSGSPGKKFHSVNRFPVGLVEAFQKRQEFILTARYLYSFFNPKTSLRGRLLKSMLLLDGKIPRFRWNSIPQKFPNALPRLQYEGIIYCSPFIELIKKLRVSYLGRSAHSFPCATLEH